MLRSESQAWETKVQQIRRRWLRATLLLVDPSFEDGTTTERRLETLGLR